MLQTKYMGLLLLGGSSALMLLYTLGIVYASFVTLQLTAFIVVIATLGVLAWVGFTMYTEPPSPELSDSSALDSLEPEEISPQTAHSRFSVILDAEIGEGTVIRDHVNLYKCKIGRNCKIESFVYLEEGVIVGDECKIKPHVFIPTGVTIQSHVFIGPNVTFTNDKHPRVGEEWTLLGTIVGDHASIGANSVILPGVRIGKNAMVGAGSVVTANVPDNTTVFGNPAKPMIK